MFDAEKVKDGLIEWIRDYFGGTTCPAVTGISGGKDSSIVAALCAAAIGKDRVYGVLMPQGEQHDIQAAFDLVNYLGIKHCVINIKDPVDAVYGAMSACGLQQGKTVLTNTPARIRMAVVYAVNAAVGGRVAGTSNLSEDWVGYSTKYGAGAAADFAPLARLTVTEVKAVGRALGLPEKFTEKVPEDGLSGLSDEDNLGFSYEALDRYIRGGVCPGAAVKEKIDRLHRINLHKVSPVPCYPLS